MLKVHLLLLNQQQQKQKQKAEPEVTVELVERTKRKRATYVGGLEQFGIKLADAAKIFRHKFATGCNPAKDRPGAIVIQGDVKFEVVDLIKSEYKAKNKTESDQVH